MKIANELRAKGDYKGFILYTLINLICTTAKIINTIVTAYIVISLYKITTNLTLDTLPIAFEILLCNPFILKMFGILVVCSIVNSLTSLICKKIEKGI